MATPPDGGKILIGPAGWSYPDWGGIVYPARRPRGFHEAAYLSRFFDTIEINTSFYHPPRAESARVWAGKAAGNPDFRFTAKLWQGFTHERRADLEDERVFKHGLAPLLESGRLGALLLQFPWSFRNNQENHTYVSGLFMQFRDYPLVLEVRHESWNQPEIFEWLAEQGVGFCNIDQPVIGKSLQPSEHATGSVGYVRLHGRNYEHWFAANERPEERYNYLYSVEELKSWAERIRNVAARTQVTFVITNNHFEGKGVANAAQLIALLQHKKVAVPETLRARYPELAAVSTPDPLVPEYKDSGLLFRL